MSEYLPLAEHKNKNQDYKRAKLLRKLAPAAEQVLWWRLRNLPEGTNIRFRRQHPLHPYIADFVSLKLKLVIELDGNSHDLRVAYDRKRDAHLAKLGYCVLRFGNQDVMKNPDGVVATILAKAKELAENNV